MDEDVDVDEDEDEDSSSLVPGMAWHGRVKGEPKRKSEALASGCAMLLSL